MTEDEKEILMRFHREVFLPDFERIFDSLSGSLELLAKDMRAGFADSAVIPAPPPPTRV